MISRTRCTPSVTALNATVNVGYGGGKVAKFVNQIITTDMSAGGDSGSLVLDWQNRPVGLLFAGGGSDTFANPIRPVLDLLGVSIVTGADGATTGAMLSDHQAIASSCPTGGDGGHGRPGGPPPGLSVAKDAVARHSDQIFALPDVIGHGIGADENGNAVIEIYVAGKIRRGAGRAYPSDVEGIPVRVIETGPIRAY